MTHATHPRVCLNMIVKNEAHVIARCLNSVRPFIDAWCIVDTGSTDGTQSLIRQLMADLPGELHERPWKDFGHNRTEALALARNHAEYLFIIDADEVLCLPPDYSRPDISGDAHALEVRYGSLRYARTCLIASHVPWRWVGVLHEYLECGQPTESPLLDGPHVLVHDDGARSQQDVRTKYAADARVLEAALRHAPDDTRYLFYLAQSYRDSGQDAAALAAYERRAAMGGWPEEVWFSLYSAALLAERLAHPFAEVMERYLRAWEFRPERGGEALGQLARFCREHQRYPLAAMFAAQSMSTPLPGDRLFVDESWYHWRCRDEYAIASYWNGAPEQCLLHCEALLSDPELPEEQRERIGVNRNFALQKLA